MLRTSLEDDEEIRIVLSHIRPIYLSSAEKYSLALKVYKYCLKTQWITIKSFAGNQISFNFVLTPGITIA